MRLDPIMIVVCDNPNCLNMPDGAKAIVREQIAISCGWLRGGLDDFVDRVLEENGWNVLRAEDFCPKCFGKEKEKCEPDPSSTSTASDATSN